MSEMLGAGMEGINFQAPQQPVENLSPITQPQEAITPIESPTPPQVIAGNVFDVKAVANITLNSTYEEVMATKPKKVLGLTGDAWWEENNNYWNRDESWRSQSQIKAWNAHQNALWEQRVRDEHQAKRDPATRPEGIPIDLSTRTRTETTHGIDFESVIAALQARVEELEAEFERLIGKPKPKSQNA